LWNEDAIGVFTNWTWYNAIVNLNAYTGQSDVKIAFQYYGYDGAEISVDDITVDASAVPTGWLTLDGGSSVTGSVLVGDPADNIVVGYDATTLPVGTYHAEIVVTTSEPGAKLTHILPVTLRVGYGVSGTVYYGTTNTKPIWNNITVTLTPVTPPGAPITVSPASGGGFDIRPLADGTYLLTGATTRPWASDQLTFDATLVLRYAAGVIGYDLTNLKKRAADVNQENVANGVNTFDATLMLRRAAVVPTPTWTAPPFVFDGPYPSTPIYLGLPVTISGGNVVQDLRTLCSGDVNGSVPIVGK